MTSRLKLILALAAFGAIGAAVVEHIDERGEERELHAEYRAPVANPPVDPNRPDLFEEPAIDE